MRYFPMFLDLAGRTVLLAGGGEAMAQKARLVGRTEARILVMAEVLCGELAALVAAGRLEHVPATFRDATVDAADLVFAATGCTGIDALIAARARARGAVVNVVDRPKLCTALTPAILDRDPLVVAIGTEGTAPVLAREVRAALEAMLEPGLGGLAALAGRLRAHVEDHVPREARLAFWEWVFGGPPRQLWAAGRGGEAEAAIRDGAARGVSPAGRYSQILLPSAPDLLPLRALARLQAAALVIHPPGQGAAVLELARRDAERCPGPADPEAVAAALGTGNVVELVAPSGRAAAEALRARLAAGGIAVECVTAADAGGAPSATGAPVAQRLAGMM
jgi:uroporphyrin-III C-methyltransferase/precorrin-2 dehydrogenase/sirohydrochlorin ferrochelatase